MLFAILAFNEKIIISIIHIFSTFAKQLSLSKKLIYNKIIIMRSNLFIIRNVIEIFFWHYIKLMKINRFDWLELIVELFNL